MIHMWRFTRIKKQSVSCYRLYINYESVVSGERQVSILLGQNNIATRSCKHEARVRSKRSSQETALEQKSLRVQTVKIGESSGFLSFDTCSMPLDSIKIEIVKGVFPAKGWNSIFRLKTDLFALSSFDLVLSRYWRKEISNFNVSFVKLITFR